MTGTGRDDLYAACQPCIRELKLHNKVMYNSVYTVVHYLIMCDFSFKHKSNCSPVIGVGILVMYDNVRFSV